MESILRRVAHAEDVHVVAVDGEQHAVNVPLAAVEHLAEVDSQVRGFVGLRPPIGFGRQPYRTADGKEREWFAVGLAPRKAALTLYGLSYDGSNTDLLERRGPHSTGQGCLYVKRLDDVDRAVLTDLVRRAWQANNARPC